ncbi:hypothetical protein PHJA_001435800 [Phtheirospermum japonicum]|uniref:Domain X domain-containing protein n=1 Tax=Phtheirospermum japonicum TaxID=374723 RepID=A0A830CCG3_9LAMI|nr:hypothetical protein PHJA_001435800 [Phtheirospermum japonicum]
MLTMDLKNHVVKFLTDNLDLKVDKSTTVIHSAVSEKIDFMGMELQAVAPSVLRPPKTEKAIRARKKYLRQKEVQLLELKNKRERNRKKLGMKLLSHVYKKSKQSNGFKFDFEIENEVRQIFGTWADEVVCEFLSSVDERWEWHRKLTAGDFLSLARIREQLPNELVKAYDNFQNQVDRYLKPVKAKRELEEQVRRKELEEEEKYAQRTVEDLTRRCVKVDASLELIKRDLKVIGVDGDGESCFFPSEKDIKMMGDRNLADPKPVDGCLTLALTRLASDESCHRCVAHFCERTNTIVYRIHLLQRYLDLNPFDENNWVPQMGVIHDSLHRKCAPLCSDHASELYMGRLTLQDIDCTGLMDVD